MSIANEFDYSIARVHRNGRVMGSAPVRKALDIKTGEYVKVVIQGNRIVTEPVEVPPKRSPRFDC